MKLQFGRRSIFKKLARDERGAVAIILTVYLPVIVGFFTLAADMSYVYWSRNMLQVTAEAAALAAASQLPDKTATITVAKQYAEKNMPAVRYGSVLTDADVVLGVWTQGCAAGGAACFVAAGAADCGAAACNAVKVNTKQATSNGNALKLAFAQIIGMSSFNVGATAIASYGPGPGSQSTWSVVVVEDISSSFSQQLVNARKADLALLDCMRANAAVGSKMGITLFTGVTSSTPYQSQQSVSDTNNYNNLKNKIAGINQCGSSGMPQCSGSNIAVGMNSAITQICPAGSTCAPSTNPSAPKEAMVIVTDGIPNCSSSIPNCSNTTLQNNAVAAANTAKQDGIDVFTIYYGDNNSDAAWLATLVRGNGIALKTPDPTKLGTLMQQICASSLSHRLVW